MRLKYNVSVRRMRSTTTKMDYDIEADEYVGYRRKVWKTTHRRERDDTGWKEVCRSHYWWEVNRELVP